MLACRLLSGCNYRRMILRILMFAVMTLYHLPQKVHLQYQRNQPKWVHSTPELAFPLTLLHVLGYRFSPKSWTLSCLFCYSISWTDRFCLEDSPRFFPQGFEKSHGLSQLINLLYKMSLMAILHWTNLYKSSWWRPCLGRNSQFLRRVWACAYDRHPPHSRHACLGW